jgi:agmatinase
VAIADRPESAPVGAGEYNPDNDDQGLPTFSSRDWVASAAALAERRPDVAIVGAPFDINTTYRPGARFGPRAIRATAYDPGTYHLDLGIDLYEWLDVVDAGDAYCPHGQSARSHRNIESKVTDVLKAGAFPIVLGGDHSITWPAATAVADVHGYGNVGIVHFDAHADTADEDWGVLAGHGTPMRRLIESGAIDGRNFVQVGLRGYWPPPHVFEWMKEHGLRWHLMREIEERGAEAVIDDAIAEALDGADSIYLSVDIDVLDPGMAPGTGTPEPGGMLTRELLRAVRRIVGRVNLAGMDVVEVAPAYDTAEITAMAAHRCVLEAISALAVKKRDGQEVRFVPAHPIELPAGAATARAAGAGG